MKLINKIASMFFVGYVVAMLTLIYDEKAVYGIPLGVLVAIAVGVREEK